MEFPRYDFFPYLQRCRNCGHKMPHSFKGCFPKQHSGTMEPGSEKVGTCCEPNCACLDYDPESLAVEASKVLETIEEKERA